jgi:hypothetical protein
MHVVRISSVVSLKPAVVLLWLSVQATIPHDRSGAQTLIQRTLQCHVSYVYAVQGRWLQSVRIITKHLIALGLILISGRRSFTFCDRDISVEKWDAR